MVAVVAFPLCMDVVEVMVVTMVPFLDATVYTDVSLGTGYSLTPDPVINKY